MSLWKKLVGSSDAEMEAAVKDKRDKQDLRAAKASAAQFLAEAEAAYAEDPCKINAAALDVARRMMP